MEALALSFGQERLWFLDRLDPGSPAYNIPLLLEIEGSLDTEVLARALSEVIRRHEVLRTACRVEDGVPAAILQPAEAVDLRTVDLQSLPEAERSSVLESLVLEEATSPFDLERAPFLRVRHYRLGPLAHVVSLVTHHFAADGWSMRVLIQEIGLLYEAFRRGDPSPLSPLRTQYADVARAERSQSARAKHASEVAWWRERLANRPPPLDLPMARRRPPVRTGRGRRREFRIGAEDSEAVRGLARRQGCTLFMVLLGGFQTLLSRYTGSKDVMVATAVSNRPRAELENLIGCFANTLLLRTDLSGDPPFADLLARVRDTAVQAYAHQSLPFEKLVEALQPERDLARTPLVQMMLVLENAPPLTVGLADLELRAHGPDPGTARLDLTVNVADDGSELTGFVEYDEDLFEAAAIDRLISHWSTLLAGAARAPERRLSELPLLTAAETAQLRAWNRTARPREPFRPLHAAILDHARLRPSAIAVEWDGGALTYADLAARAGRLANYLRKRGVGPEEPVGVFLDRGPDLVVALLGILGAGGAYVPLEPDHPDERVAFILEDSGTRLVLTCEALATRLARRSGLEPVVLDRDAARIRLERETPPEIPLEGQNLCYVLYTSGSTGRPKGAMNTHAALVNRLEWMQEAFGLEPDDRVAQKTPFGFDVSVWELFWPLRTGARLVLARPGGHRDPVYLAQWIGNHGITVIHFVPSMLQPFLDTPGLDRLGTLRLVISSGEALTRPLVERFHERLHAQLHNLYGPTEAAVDVSHAPCARGEDGTVPIGRPISNATLHVFDESLEPVPVGVPGELYIGGTPLARGYRGAPGRTAERFVPDPRPLTPGERLYRTGDRARWNEDGALEFLGRLDHQVKLRGVRIELAEVEGALKEHRWVRDAAVALDPSGAEPRLVGYVVPVSKPPSSQDLRRHLLGKLPEAMVPGRFVILPSLPIGATGKLDRRALPRPTRIEASQSGSGAPPVTPFEERLAAIWRELLDVEHIGSSDTFFDLGGHSLLAARLIARVRDRFGMELPLRAVFETPALGPMARVIEAGAGSSEPHIPVTPRSAVLPLSHFQERLWFLEQFEPGTPNLNLPVAVRLRGALDAASLARSLDLLLHRHEALRVRFRIVEGRPVQECLSVATVPLEREDLSGLPPGARERRLGERVAAEAGRPFNLDIGPLVRAVLVRLDDAEHVLLLTVHHIAADGWSVAVLLDELSRVYDALSHGAECPLKPPVLQYSDFALWQRGRLGGEALERSLAYWRRALDGAPPHLDLPADFQRPPVQSYRGGRTSRRLSAAWTERLRGVAGRHNATLFMSLLAALDVVLSRWSGQEEIVVGAPIAGRPRLELEHVVGPFLNTLPFRVSLSGNPTFVELLERVRTVAVEAYEHQEVPFEKVLESVPVARDLARTPVFQVLLNVLNFPVEVIHLSDLTLEVVSQPDPPSKFDLTIYVDEDEKGLRLELVYNADLFALGRMDELLRQLERVVVETSERPDVRILEIDLRTRESLAVLPDPSEPLEDSFPGPVHERFSTMAGMNSRRIALDSQSGTWSYGDLEADANRLARHLVTLGVRRGDVVTIYARRTAGLAWAVLATLKAGGVFSILDPSYPARRLIQILGAARPAVFIHLKETGPLPRAIEEHLASVRDCARLALPSRTSASEPWSVLPADPPRVDVGPDDGACLTFTSGSTGEPKGVLGLHRSLSHFIDWQREAWGLSDADRFSMLSSLAHDPLQRDLFTPLQLGAALCIPDESTLEHPRDLAEWAAREGITVMHLTPAMLQVLAEGGGGAGPLRSLRRALVVGDALTRRDVERLRKLAPECVCINLYGATETQRAVGYHVIPRHDSDEAAPRGALEHEILPMGRGIRDVQLLVVNGAGRLCGVGELGEVWVRSPHLAAGYLRDEALTRERFRVNPFGSTQASDRVYRTGDLGRYTCHGAVEGAGRADRQVKVRGFRIEPAEIEAILGRHPDIRECAVTARDDAPGGRGLVAYVAARGRSSPGSEELQRYLADRLPRPMIPVAFVEVPRLPRTPTGKLDRDRMPAPKPGSSGSRPARDTLELQLTRLWEEVLERRPIGVRDDFFAVGGHSLLAVRLVAKVEALWGIRLPLAALFRGPTVEQMASLVRSQSPAHGRRSPLIPIRPTGSEPPVFCVHPVGGTVLCYNALAQHLGMEQPFFGLEALGVEGDCAPLTTVEAMATAYLDAVRSECPRGPYRLAGWSFGGLVAFEMARRLRVAGHDASLVLIDVWPPGSLGPLEDLTDEATILRLLARALGDLSGKPFEVESDRLQALGDREAQLAFVVAEAHQVGALPPDVGVERLRPLFGVISANVAARRRFQPQTLPGSLVLVRAREAMVPVLPSPTLEWEQIVEGGVEEFEVDGDHYTMMAEPHVREVARCVASSYSGVRAG